MTGEITENYVEQVGLTTSLYYCIWKLGYELKRKERKVMEGTSMRGRESIYQNEMRSTVEV